MLISSLLFAYKAQQAKGKIATMLPCNVMFQEKEAVKTEVSMVYPAASMQAIQNPALKDIAGQVREKLKRVIENLIV